jgi:hypothetical protein
MILLTRERLGRKVHIRFVGADGRHLLPQEILRALLLASDIGSTITGQAYNVDGGAVMFQAIRRTWSENWASPGPAQPARIKLTYSNTII